MNRVVEHLKSILRADFEDRCPKHVGGPRGEKCFAYLSIPTEQERAENVAMMRETIQVLRLIESAETGYYKSNACPVCGEW